MHVLNTLIELGSGVVLTCPLMIGERNWAVKGECINMKGGYVKVSLGPRGGAYFRAPYKDTGTSAKSPYELFPEMLHFAVNE